MPDHIHDPLWDPLRETALATFIRESLWAYPTFETLHLFGMALVFCPIVLFDLRVLGFNRDFNIKRLHQTLLPWVWTGFALNLVSGVLLFISDASEFANSPPFIVKIVLIGVAGLNAMLFQKLVFPRLAGADDTSRVSRAAKISAVGSILLWTTVIIAGRLIAYIK